MATVSEQETTVTYDRQERVYRVWSSFTPHINRYKKDERAKLVREGEDFAEFTISDSDFDITKGFKRKVRMTDEQRAAAGARLANVRPKR